MPRPYIGPAAREVRKAVRALVAAARAVQPSQPSRRQELARLALETYDVATEHDGGFYLPGDDIDCLREWAAWSTSQATTRFA